MIEDGVNGFVVPCRNAKVLANKMKEMLGNTSMAESMARAARRLSDTHNEQIIFDRWNAFLLRVCTRTD